MAVVVISSIGEGDRSGGSLEVKAPGGWELPGQIRPGGRATWQAVADANRESPEIRALREADCGRVGSAGRSDLGEGPCRDRETGHQPIIELPGVIEGGKSGKNGQ